MADPTDAEGLCETADPSERCVGLRVSEGEMVDSGELNSRHRDFQAVQDVEPPSSPFTRSGLIAAGSDRSHIDTGFADERQLDV
jgi:hypothetical protein